MHLGHCALASLLGVVLQRMPGLEIKGVRPGGVVGTAVLAQGFDIPPTVGIEQKLRGGTAAAYCRSNLIKVVGGVKSDSGWPEDFRDAARKDRSEADRPPEEPCLSYPAAFVFEGFPRLQNPKIQHQLHLPIFKFIMHY